MGLRGERRKVNMKDEYYVRITGNIGIGRAWLTTAQRLQAKDLEDWEQRRVKRLPGEPDGTLV